jgi:hypothetical protein
MIVVGMHKKPCSECHSVLIFVYNLSSFVTAKKKRSVCNAIHGKYIERTQH